jgi:hypothetical protein
MSRNAPIKSIDDIVEFLVPLIDVTTCDRTSLTGLKQNHKEIIDKLNETGRPVLLSVSGRTVLVCNANIYFGLETKRRCLFSYIPSVEEALAHAGVVEIANAQMGDLANEQDHIARLEADIKDEKWHVKKKERELKDARARATSLTADLRKSKTVAGPKEPKDPIFVMTK